MVKCEVTLKKSYSGRWNYSTLASIISPNANKRFTSVHQISESVIELYVYNQDGTYVPDSDVPVTWFTIGK